MKAVVIGANGFIGRNMSLHLAKHGYKVTALVAQGFTYDFLLGKENITCVEYNFDSLTTLNNHPAVLGASIIYHMAWSGVSTTYKNEAEMQAHNVIFGLKVIEFAKDNQIPRVIVPGSASEFGCGNGVIDGLKVAAPTDMYSASKVATRYVCQTYAQQNNIEFIWTAITSIYGPGRIDNNLITYAIKSLLAGEKPSFTGLEQQWDYLYIDDLMYALQALGEKGKSGKIYPIGSGEHQQMVEYVKIIRDKINPALPLGIGEKPYKNKTIDNQIMDITELVSDTGFAPHYTFEQGIEQTINYFKQNN